MRTHDHVLRHCVICEGGFRIFLFRYAPLIMSVKLALMYGLAIRCLLCFTRCRQQ